MKRVKAACICQTLHFSMKESLSYECTRRTVQQEVENYKAGLERSRTQYRIVEEIPQADGSLILKIIKQYNSSDLGDYLN